MDSNPGGTYYRYHVQAGNSLYCFLEISCFLVSIIKRKNVKRESFRAETPCDSFVSRCLIACVWNICRAFSSVYKDVFLYHKHLCGRAADAAVSRAEPFEHRFQFFFSAIRSEKSRRDVCWQFNEFQWSSRLNRVPDQLPSDHESWQASAK